MIVTKLLITAKANSIITAEAPWTYSCTLNTFPINWIKVKTSNTFGAISWWIAELAP
jgi:hypothetical protein